jgi:hypothetical protein
LPLHFAFGTQLTLVIRTVSTCGLVAVRVLVAGDGAVGPAPPLTLPWEVPPALAAVAHAAEPSRTPSEQDDTAASVAARRLIRSLDRLWAALIAKTIPSLRRQIAVPVRRRPRLAAMPSTTRQRHRSCVSSSRSRSPKALARVGSTAVPPASAAG